MIAKQHAAMDREDLPLQGRPSTNTHNADAPPDNDRSRRSDKGVRTTDNTEKMEICGRLLAESYPYQLICDIINLDLRDKLEAVA